jgi:RHS repeat-associated protein
MILLRNGIRVLVVLAFSMGLFLPDAQASGGKNQPTRRGMTIFDPVSVADGAFSTEFPLFDLGGPMNLHFTLLYDQSIDNYNGYFPFGMIGQPGYWWSPFACAQFARTAEPQTCDIKMTDGSSISFFQTNGLWQMVDEGSPAEFKLVVTNDPADKEVFYFMDPLNERVYIFDLQTLGSSDERRLLHYVFDRHYNRLEYQYSSYPRVTNITDGLGRTLSLAYDNADDLVEVRDQAGRTARFVYEENASDNLNLKTLRYVVQPDGGSNRIGYVALTNENTQVPGNIVSVTHPRGNTPLVNQYRLIMRMEDGFPMYYARVTNQTDALGHSFALNCDPNFSSSVRYPDGSVEQFAQSSAYAPSTNIVDAQGHTIRYGQDAATRITTVTDRLGGGSKFTYDSDSGLLSSATNALGNTMRFEYETATQRFTNPVSGRVVTFAFRQLHRKYQPDGSYEEYTRDGHGRVTERRDSLGNIWRYGYNALGQVTNIANPCGGEVSHRYDAAGRLLGTRDSETGETVSEYDAAGRLIRTIEPNGATTSWGLDPMDRMTALTNALNHVWRYEYDANGNRTRVTEPDGSFATYTYDVLDRMVIMSNRVGGRLSCTYDNRGQVASVTDAGGCVRVYQYDSRGWVTNVNWAGRNWATSYDREGAPISIQSPLGYRTSFGLDVLGRPTSVTNALGQAMRMTYDSFGRLSSSRDPTGRTQTNLYDSAGNLTGVILPNGAQAVYRYDALGNVTNVVDLNGRTWVLGHSPEGRLTLFRDPLNASPSFAYDEQGRLNFIMRADGTIAYRRYDLLGQCTNIAYPSGPSLEFAYDARGRMTRAGTEFFAYDAEGHMTNQLFPDGRSIQAAYDLGGRVTNVVLPGGLGVAYTWNNRDLLTDIRDSLGGHLQFTYNDDRQLTRVDRDAGVSTIYSWNSIGQVTGVQHGTLSYITRTLNAVGAVVRETRSVPLDLSMAVGAATNVWVFDQVSRVAMTGYQNDLQNRRTLSAGASLQWDSAGRLTNMGGIAYGYNAEGRLIRRTAGGTTNTFLYGAVLNDAPVVEVDAVANTVRRYYICDPSGQLLYLIDAEDGNKVYHYHFDLSGNTVALSEAGGTVAAAYALDPFGLLLAQTGAIAVLDQPFTFAGQFGVRAEGTNGFYLAGQRWYDACTAHFVTMEPLWPQTASPTMLNPFQYAANDPVANVDSTGLQVFDVNAVRNDGFLVEARRLLDVYNQQVHHLTTMQRYLAEEADKKTSALSLVGGLAGLEQDPVKRQAVLDQIQKEIKEIAQDVDAQEARMQKEIIESEAYKDLQEFLGLHRKSLEKIRNAIKKQYEAFDDAAKKEYARATRLQNEQMLYLYHAYRGRGLDPERSLFEQLREKTKYMMDRYNMLYRGAMDNHMALDELDSVLNVYLPPASSAGQQPGNTGK